MPFPIRSGSHWRRNELVDHPSLVLSVHEFSDKAQVLKSTKAVVNGSWGQIGPVNQVLPGHPAPAFKKHVKELGGRR